MQKSDNCLMHLINALTQRLLLPKPAAIFAATCAVFAAVAQSNAPLPVVEIRADKVAARMPPTFYGLMTEEINYAFEGGLYGELIRNRAFKADAIQKIIKPEDYDPAKYYPAKFTNGAAPKFWSAVGNAVVSLDSNNPLNAALNVSLKLDVASASPNSPAGIANGGFWGIPIRPRAGYQVSFFARSAAGFAGPLVVSLESADGKTVFARAEIFGLTGDWQKYETTLTVKKVKPSRENVFKLTTSVPGTFWVQQVSLFPQTYQNRPNGNRADISQLLAAAQPKFLRFPGGNYVEGDYFSERFNWKETIGPVELRPGHRSCWNYWSTDGFGLPEFLGWCQDLNMEPVLAVFAGYTLKHDYRRAGTRSLRPGSVGGN